MSHEYSQPDIFDRDLLKTSASPRVSYSREIGEATISHTIFGKAKVRITRKYDALRRMLWLAALAAVAAVAWQMWRQAQPEEAVSSADSIPPANDRTMERLPDSPDDATQPAVTPVAPSQAVAGSGVTTVSPEPIGKPVPQAPPMTRGGPLSAKPLPHPAATVRPQLPPHPASAVVATTLATRELPSRPYPQHPVGAASPAAPHLAASATPVVPPLASPIDAPAPVTPPVAAKPLVVPASAPAG